MSLQNLFVAKLPRNLTDMDLQQIFAEFHPSSAKVMLEASSGKSKGFGFVLFHTEAEGRVAYEAMNRRHVTTHGHHFNLCIFPSHHTGRAAVSASNALYVRNIPATVPQSRVEQFLASFGTLTYCAMREDHYGNPVWVVYAEYDCLDCSRHALHKLHGSFCYFRSNVCIMAKYADSEESRQERRRRREEGAIAPAPRRSHLFPPNAPSISPLLLPNTASRTPRAESPLSNSNSFGPETPADESLRKSPIHTYRHNPYALGCFATQGAPSQRLNRASGGASAGTPKTC